MATKLGAMAIGLLLTIVLQVLELPLEAVLAALLPVAGIAVDFAVDGLEFAILPFVFASIVMTRLAPKPALAMVRAERNRR